MATNFDYFAVNQFQQPSSAAVADIARQQLIDEQRAIVATKTATPATTAEAAQYYSNPSIITQSLERAWLLQNPGGGHQIIQQQQIPTATLVQHVQQAGQGQALTIAPHQPQQEQVEKNDVLFRCPDCSKSFKHASGVFIHASQTHYGVQLQQNFWPQIEMTSTCPICSKPIDKAKYLAHVGAKHKKIILFMTPEKRDQYLNIEKLKLTVNRRKKGQNSDQTGAPAVRETKFRCPDCDKAFAFVAPLYIHAATTHYNEQIKAKYVPVYREHGKCHLCGCLVSQTSLVSHFGGKHRRILTFMDEEKRQQYMSMKKRTWTNFREAGGLACAYDDCNKEFKNLTMYKQHLANTHVRTELLHQARKIEGSKCNFCGKIMPKQYSLLQHIGTCHNQVLHYVPPEVQQHLAQLGVKEPEPESI